MRASELLGRGGAAFPTWAKWDGAAKAPGEPKYFVINADESEPGTFKDRVLLEGDPCRVLEGAIIGAYAIGASRIYIYIRGEYPLAIERVGAALEELPRGRLSGRQHPGVGLQRRRRDSQRRRRLHLRRGDGALRVHRGQARLSTRQATLPHDARPLRQAHSHQQRGDAGAGALHPEPRTGRLSTAGYGRIDRAEAALCVGRRRATGAV